jgi:glycogen operon protein
MICGGDEIGRTQKGNNNAYCQDNEVSWYNWHLTHEQRDLMAFCRHLIRLVRKHPVFRRRNFFQGRRIRGADVKDLTWFEPTGQEMTDAAWSSTSIRSLMVRLDGESIDEADAEGNRIVDDTFLLLMNADRDSVAFTLPAHRLELPWVRLLDTSESDWGRTAVLRGNRYRVRGRSMAVFRSRSHTRPTLAPAENGNNDVH